MLPYPHVSGYYAYNHGECRPVVGVSRVLIPYRGFRDAYLTKAVESHHLEIQTDSVHFRISKLITDSRKGERVRPSNTDLSSTSWRICQPFRYHNGIYALESPQL